MAKSPTSRQAKHRDGTSQAGRLQAALDPGYVSLDERSYEDLLAFAWRYAGELKYVDEDDREAGDWRAFFGPDAADGGDLESSLGEIVAFMADPDSVAPERRAVFERPHFALFLTFLQLLRHAQDKQNGLTARHLDFYYRDVLGMTKKPAVPDRVNVLLETVADVEELELPAGTLLAAGQDDLGEDLVYRTDRRILVNRATIGRLSSVFADKRITGIREGREETRGTARDKALAMLSIALGDPLPGDPLPPYRRRAADFALLKDLRAVIDFARDGLELKFFELRDLVTAKRRRDGADDDWAAINRLFEKAGRTRQSGFKLEPERPRDFDANLAKAIGGKPSFAGITQVESVYDLYAEYQKDPREELTRFIREKLYFDDPTDFTGLMQIKGRVDADWTEINRTLERAGQRKRKDPTYQLSPEPGSSARFDPSDFVANVKAALGTPAFGALEEGAAIADVEQYHDAVRRVEAYFHLSAESLSYLLAVVADYAEPGAGGDTRKPTSRDWDKVYRLLAEAYRDKTFAGRRAHLKDLREAAESPAVGFKTIVCVALGEDPESADSGYLGRLEDFVAKEGDFALLQRLAAQLTAGQAATEHWGDVYRIVELAQRARERLPEPVPRREEWLNLYAHEDATAAAASLGLEADEDNPRWKTFGQQRPALEPGTAPAETLGWAVSSPLLMLSEGRRQIVLTLGFPAELYEADKIDPLFPADPERARRAPLPFRFQASTAEGWIEPDSVVARLGAYEALTGARQSGATPLKALQFTVTFSEEADPIGPLAPEGQGAAGEIGMLWPVLRLMLRQFAQPGGRDFVTHYAPFKGLALERVHLKVAVGRNAGQAAPGLSEIRIQNDEATLDSKKPFEPFGVAPSVGARFHLGHPELVHKRLDSLTFDIEWMGVPINPRTHYRAYPGTDGNFRTRISLIDRTVEFPIAPAAPLFAAGRADRPHQITVPNIARALGERAASRAYRYERALEAPDDDDLLAWDRYLRWELTPTDFQHGAFPAVSARKALELAAAIANQAAAAAPKPAIKAESYDVKPPYTPKMKSLGLSYDASLEIDVKAYSRGPETDQIFHIHAFGYNEVQPERPGQAIAFLPQYDHEGELYIGLQDAVPPQTVSLLFQMAEGSADPDLAPVPVEWSYLSDDRWLSLGNGNVLLDTTRGLINSGVVELRLEPAAANTRLPAGHYWLRAAIARNGDSVCDTIAIHTQAVSASFLDRGNAASHYARPLPAETITETVVPEPGLDAVKQPYTSFGGKTEEEHRVFYTRISERLRHRQRALTPWDYERLVLERFPQLYKAKCLPAGSSGRPEDIGQVEIVVIPDIRNQVPFDPFEPKVPADLIADIEGYLADKIPPYADVRVRNPHYVPVKIRFGVRFRPDRDEGFYIRKLNEELKRFLSPWAYEEAADITIGGRIYANSIVNFVDERDYVDYIATISLFSSDDGRRFVAAQGSEEEGYYVTTERPGGVLVSARRHEIDVIAEGGYEEESFTGIDFMKIELDFTVK